MGKNSPDLLRLIAAAIALFGYPFALWDWHDPQVFGLNTLGGAGGSTLFLLSGYLVWTSWARDPDVWRLHLGRSLRMFPGLWVVCLLSTPVARGGR